MRFDPSHRSENVVDRRAGGGMRGMPIKLGLGGTVLVALLAFGAQAIFGVDAGGILDAVSGAEGAPGSPIPAGQDAESAMVGFVSTVVDDAQTTFATELGRRGQAYRPAKLVLFRNSVQSPCGYTSSATGPFYCPGDEQAYIDLSFYDDLRQRFGAPGDFAQAYVIAHELGHHVQNVLGTERAMRQQVAQNPALENDLSVRLELQADCYAGVWAHSAGQRSLLETGDIEEALQAASAIGDDRLQRQAGGRVNPETFTHGTSQQRTTWFRRGYDAGSLDACQTFQAAVL